MKTPKRSKAASPVFPVQGAPLDAVMRRLEALKGGDVPEAYGQFSLYAMEGGAEVQEVGMRAFEMFFGSNAIFSSMVESLAWLEDEVLAMCVEIMNGGTSGRANITSGGSESIYSALHAMRQRARATHPHIAAPELVVPYSAHAAFSRGAHYLDLKLVRTALGADHRADLAALEEAIGSNTIGIAASAPCWPFGLFDSISEIGEIARGRGLWLHVDACVGGFLAPFVRKAGYEVPAFDLAVPGVSSISADLHKYGYTPKPCSLVLWRSEAEQSHHYVAAEDWPSGLYLTQSMLGSRPAAATAAAWAVMNYLGEEGYVAIAGEIMETKRKLADGIAKIEGLRPWDSDLSLMAVESDDLEVDALIAGMAAKGWALLGNREPPLLHLTVEPAADDVIELFLADLRDVIGGVAGAAAPRAATYGTDPQGGGDGGPLWLRRALSLLEARSSGKRP
jgi:glutamate/tyrosine decarboxylase-like PLP-dependent enzyme